MKPRHTLAPAPPAVKARLTSVDHCGQVLRITLNHLPVVIGRNPEADVRVSDQWISRVHCEISELEGVLVVRDLDSRNGTGVNGEYIKEAHLMPGDRLTVGLTTFEVQYKCSRKRSMAAAGSGR